MYFSKAEIRNQKQTKMETIILGTWTDDIFSEHNFDILLYISERESKI